MKSILCLLAAFLCAWPNPARSEAMLQLFNVNWDELIQKMPEIAEAGYTSLWLPPPAKAGSVFSVGYDQFDAFDLGDKDQRGTIRTRYGTKEQLLAVVEMAHRFGIRVYLDNIMNHRGFDIPGFNSSTPTNLYPGLIPQDFHLQRTSSGTYANWWNVSNWGNVWEVQHQPLFGLIDLATEPGSLNENFGSSLGNSVAKPSFIRQPGMNSYYMDGALPSIGGPWRPFNGNMGDPVAEDVNSYLIRAAMWTMYETRCDGFRFDAVKHVPSAFFGNTIDNFEGYAGAIQAIYDYMNGYGANVITNGYTETGGNRDSLFNTEAARNDALLFGEHLGSPPDYQEYLDRGMRLLNSPYHYQLNNILGNPGATLSGLDQRDYRPHDGAFTGPESVLFAQSHDDAVANRRELQNAYNFTREGLPSIYSDGYNQSTANPGEEPFPRHAYAPYLGQFGDNKMPDLAWLHHQVARGGTRSRWSDADIVAYERYDYREAANGYTNSDATVVLFAMNDNYAGAISFDDGVAQTTAGTFYECFPASNSRGVGLVVGFTPGSVLYQLADAPNRSQACTKLLVRQATSSIAEAQATANDPNPVNRKVYVGSQALFPGGGAIEFKIPAGSYVIYGYQWPEPSRANLYANAIVLMQGGAPVPRVNFTRRDGVNGDSGFSPLYPFKMRGSVDSNGNVVAAAPDTNAYTYEIDVPVVTNGPMDIVVRSDGSASGALVKMDGGIDLNSQMGLGTTTGFDRRDNKPGYAADIYLGYEEAAQAFRYGPEKFAAQSIDRNNVTSAGAETYYYTVGAGSSVVNGSGNGFGISNSTASWVYHDPAATNTSASATATQRVPFAPTVGQDVQVFVKAGYKLQINRCLIYYTADGSNPEGAFGSASGTTRVVEATWAGEDVANTNIDWWVGTIGGSNHNAGTQIRYKVALFRDDVGPMTDADSAKWYGINQAAITNFNPTTATVWLHNNLNTNDTATGLRTGFHILRARPHLPRVGKSSVFNTFLQTFYYAGPPPEGVIAYPAANGATVTNSSYTVVVRGDSGVTSAEYTIQDLNGSVSGVAAPASPEAGLTQQYPGFPKEFRFSYNPVASSGSATITVRLKDFASAVYTNRFTSLVRTINAQAPELVLNIVNPAVDGSLLTISNGQIFSIQACYSGNLGFASSNFSVLINGEFQPRSSYIFRSSGCGSGFRTLYYNWADALPGSNVVQIVFTNALTTLGDMRQFAVNVPGNTLDSDGDGVSDSHEVISGTNPYDATSVLRIVDLAPGPQTGVTWSSVPTRNYEVWAATNLALPMQPISEVIPALSTNVTWADPTPDPTNKFYRIRVIE